MFPQSHRDCPEAASQVARTARDDEPGAGCGSSKARQTEADQMLSEIYNWFTEGFDTKDLQEAKALLDGALGIPVREHPKTSACEVLPRPSIEGDNLWHRNIRVPPSKSPCR